LDCIGFPEVVR